MQRSRKSSGSQVGQWAAVEPSVIPDWEAAHVFMEVARCGSFRAASRKLRQSVNALRRKIDEFERVLGAPLLVRHVNGVRLTQEGSEICNAALQMEMASFGLIQARNASEKKIEGEVRLAVTEGLGTFWILPKLVEFERANPRLLVNLRCAMKSADVLRLEADLSVQLDRPHAPDLIVTKLGRMHLMLFAAKSYINAYGCPTSPSDFIEHRFAILSDYERQWQQSYEKLFPKISPVGFVSVCNNVSSAHFSSILEGAGIGILPTYVQAAGANLVPMHLGVDYGLDIWLAYHPDAKRIARVQKTIEWLIASFDPRRFPWFRDEFIHPDQFTRHYRGEPVVSKLVSIQADK